MLAVDAAVRCNGSPGFNTQTLLWLDGNIDIDTLTSALQRLSRNYPVITSRLQVRGWNREPHWVFRSGTDCPLYEIDVLADDRGAVLHCTSELLSQEFDLYREAPIRFYLLHRRSAGDVFVVQYSHVLMDHPAIIGLLKAIERLSREEPGGCGDPKFDGRDVLAEYLASHSRSERLRAAWSTASLRLIGLRHKIALFGGNPDVLQRPLTLRVATRILEAQDAAALTAQVTAACRFPGISMALLASVFRTGHQLGLVNCPEGRFTTGIGLELGLRTEQEALLQNLSSVVPLVAEPAQLTSRQELTRQLNGQLRERLQQRVDLGVIALSSNLRRRRGIVRFAMRRLMRTGYSVWYGYFGSPDGLGTDYLGVPIEDFCYFGPSWPAVGLTIIAHRFRERLQLHATYVPACLSENRAEAFMDALVEDLRGWSA